MQIWARQQEKTNLRSRAEKTPKTNTLFPPSTSEEEEEEKEDPLGRSVSEGLVGPALSQLRLCCHHRGETGSAKAKRRRSTTMITDGNVDERRNPLPI